jgi:hypothetical protein
MNAHRKTLNECMVFPFAKATLTRFLEKEDNNLRFFYEMRPRAVNKHIRLNEFEIPRGFSNVLHQKFYFNPQKFLRKQEIDTIDKMGLWSNALDEIVQTVKTKKLSDEDAGIIQKQVTTNLKEHHLTKYMYVSQTLIDIRKKYFTEILLHSNELCPKDSMSHIEVANMKYRDEVLKKMFPEKKEFEEFFNNYITKKYEFQRLELIATTTLFDIYDKFMPNGNIKQELQQEYNKIQNKLSAKALKDIEQLETKLIENRANIRIYNSKFKEKITQNIYSVTY